MTKTASFGVMHLGTAFGVTYAMTGSVAIAGAVTFVEPLVNTVLHYFHDKHWDGFERRVRALFRRQPAHAKLNPA
jgi:uncharacterized membrane protein